MRYFRVLSKSWVAGCAMICVVGSAQTQYEIDTERFNQVEELVLKNHQACRERLVETWKSLHPSLTGCQLRVDWNSDYPLLQQQFESICSIDDPKELGLTPYFAYGILRTIADLKGQSDSTWRVLAAFLSSLSQYIVAHSTLVPADDQKVKYLEVYQILTQKERSRSNLNEVRYPWSTCQNGRVIINSVNKAESTGQLSPLAESEPAGETLDEQPGSRTEAVIQEGGIGNKMVIQVSTDAVTPLKAESEDSQTGNPTPIIIEEEEECLSDPLPTEELPDNERRDELNGGEHNDKVASFLTPSDEKLGNAQEANLQTQKERPNSRKEEASTVNSSTNSASTGQGQNTGSEEEEEEEFLEEEEEEEEEEYLDEEEKNEMRQKKDEHHSTNTNKQGKNKK